MSSFGKKVNGLLKKFKNGDENAFVRLVDVVYNRLIYVASIFLYDKSRAEDVALDAMYIVYKSIAKYDLKSDGYKWICKMVQTSAKKVNSERRDVILQSDVYTEEMDFDKIHTRCDTDRILARLSDEDYELVVLRFYLDKTYEEIGKILGFSTKQAYSRVQNVLKELKKSKIDN